MPVEQLVISLCNLKQGYTQFGGMRPFGVSFIYAGYDKVNGFQLFQSDPSGNYSGWKATCMGTNHTSATSILKQEYSDDMDLEAAQLLACKVLSKTMEGTSMTSDKLEFSVLKLVDGKIQICEIESNKVDQLIKIVQDEAKEKEESK